MSIAPHNNRLPETIAPPAGDIAAQSIDIAPTVPTIDDVAELLGSKYRYSELVHVLSPGQILKEMADAEDVLLAEMFSDQRDLNPAKVKDPATGKVMINPTTGEPITEPKLRTRHEVNTNSVGLAHAALARYGVVYGMIHNLDTLFNSGIHFDLAEKHLSEAGDTVGRQLNARRAAEAAALVGDEEMLAQYAPLTGWSEERIADEWDHYTDMRETLQARWEEMHTDAVSFEPDGITNQWGEVKPESTESMAFCLGVAVKWNLNEYARLYVEEIDAPSKLYESIDQDNPNWHQEFTGRVVRDHAVSAGISNLALHHEMTLPQTDEQQAA